MRLKVKPTRKQARQDMILRLIKDKQVKTQDDLAKLLLKYSFETTQSSLSRDISELNLVKQQGCYVIPQQQVSASTPLVTGIDSAGSNLIVVKTLIGMAGPVGITIDNHKIPQIIGTVSGDDTVFIATAPGASHEVVKKSVRKLFRGA
ncbi:MAG: arginine repressor [Deltaproteobacteria bacterium]|nr:arginine repressor [Deltaproteobacteria bacterium]